MKRILIAGAFLLAIGTAFATKSNHTKSLASVFVGPGGPVNCNPDQCFPTGGQPCTTINTVWQDANCSIPETVNLRKP